MKTSVQHKVGANEINKANAVCAFSVTKAVRASSLEQDSAVCEVLEGNKDIRFLATKMLS